jgi:hypothetical protein
MRIIGARSNKNRTAPAHTPGTPARAVLDSQAQAAARAVIANGHA